MTPLHIAIVGAGFAGLRCADILLQNGHQVTIFEARNRLGGRVAQSDFGGHLVDLGPNWIHGTDNNPMVDLATRTATPLHSWTQGSYTVGVDGIPWSRAETDSATKIFWDQGLIDEAFRYSNEHHDTIDVQTSLEDFFTERIDAMFTDLPTEQAERKRTRLKQMATVWGAYVGSSVTTQSLKFFWLEECIEGETPFVAGTYEKILAEVKKRAEKDARIHLEAIVDRVSSSSSHDGRSLQRQVTVQLRDGTKFEFDQVVVTTPLGILKRHPELFDPPAPPRLRQAIENIGYGSLDKIYVRFASAFWDTTPHETTADDTKSPSSFADAIHWLPPAYAPETNPSQWDIQGMNLAALPSPCAHPTILFYIYGDCSAHVASIVQSSTSHAQRDDRLLEFITPYFSRLPNYDPADVQCRVEEVLTTAWAADEFAGYGSYANFQVGLARGDEDVETMRHGMPERGIWLAGEHTAPFVALGTSTGAYWSGEAVAKRILERHGPRDELTSSEEGK